MARMPRMQVVQAVQSAQVRRKTRSPRHHFSISQQPYEIRPFFIAPVLPGETLKSLRISASQRSGYMIPQMSGWWSEMYLFYVKHRDLVQRDLITDIHVKNVTNAALVSAVRDELYDHPGVAGAINWTKMCLRRVTEEFFRNEGEAWDVAVSPDGLPLAAVNGDTWLDSAIRDGAVPSGSVQGLPDELLEEANVEDSEVPPGFETAYDHWLVMRRNNMIETDFEDYLRANGVKVPEKEVNPHRPELIRYVRDFKKPKRGVASTGEELSLFEWDLAESADKDRFFREPGFLFGVTVFRPKTYLSQRGGGVPLLNDAWSWLPALLGDNPETSLRTVPAAAAHELFPGYSGTADVVIDMRDLFIYGDQMIAGEFALDRINVASSPGADFGRRYVNLSPDWVPGIWFATHVDPVPVSYNPPPEAFLSEGVVSFSIASRIQGDGSGYGANFNPAVA